MGSRLDHVARVFKDAKKEQLPKSRLNQIYVFATGLLKFPTSQPGVIWSGCIILGNLGDKSAIPSIQPLRYSTDANVRKFAEATLKQLGSK